MTACLILDLKILDFPAFAEYIGKVPAFIEKHGRPAPGSGRGA